MPWGPEGAFLLKGRLNSGLWLVLKNKVCGMYIELTLSKGANRFRDRGYVTDFINTHEG